MGILCRWRIHYDWFPNECKSADDDVYFEFHIEKQKKIPSADSINRAYFPEMDFKHIIYVCISEINSW